MTTPQVLGVPRARPIVEIGVGSTNDPAGGAAWQPAAGGPANTRWHLPGETGGAGDRWVGRDPYWWDVTCDVYDIETFIGRERANAQWDIGTATISLRNETGWADYPPADPAQTYLTVRPGRPIRVRASIDGGEPEWVWGGYIDVQSPTYDASDGESVTLECIDAKAESGRAQLGLADPPVGANETVVQRLNRYLDMIDWPPWRRDLAPSALTLQATSLDARVVDLVNLAADSALGFAYGDREGRVAFRPRDWAAFLPSDPIAGIIGNYGTGTITGGPVNLVESTIPQLYEQGGHFVERDPGLHDPVSPTFLVPTTTPGLYTLSDVKVVRPVCPQSWELTFAREDISTEVRFGRATDPEQVPPTAPIFREDVTAKTMFGVETFERTDLETVQTSDLVVAADRTLAVRSYRYMPRVAAVTLNAATDPGVIDAIMAADPYLPARFVCRHEANNGRHPINRTMLVTGVEHTIRPDEWETRIALDEAAPFTLAKAASWSNGVDNTARWNNRQTPNALMSAWTRHV
jgi:hypothetical protein